ncbi:BatD family protein, partial [Pseudoxanthomonas taiwanensis]
MNDPLYPRRDQRTSRRLRGACLALLWLLAGVAGAETRAWLDRSQVREGETVTLNIQTDQPGVAPDYTPLQADFEVGSPFRSDTAGRGVLFGVRLVPRRAGALEVPALRVGAERTPPLALRVGGERQDARGEVFLETRVEEEAPWVQQSVGVSVRLYFATPLLSGELTQEPPEGA